MKNYQSNTYWIDSGWLHFDMSQGFKRDSTWRTNATTCFCKSTRPGMTTVVSPYGRFIKIQSNLRREKPYRKTQGSNFLGGHFSNRDNVRVPIQFRRERQPQHLKRLLFHKNTPNYFHITSNSVTWPLKQDRLSFSSTEINKPLPAPRLHCLIDQIRIQKLIVFVAIDQMPDYT